MKKSLLKILTGTLAAFMMLGTCASVASFAAGQEVGVSSTAVTVISLADKYSDFTYNGKSDAKIYIEKSLCPEAYFDNVRIGDTISVQIRVGAAGTYNVCLVTGWANGVAGGNFTFLLDGSEIGSLVNKVAGIDWRTWKDTTAAQLELPAGVHTFTIKSNADGPNIQGLKFAPENVVISEKNGKGDLCTGGQGAAIEVKNTYGVQFCTNLPISEISVVAPSYNNDKGTFKLSLFKWSESYEKTLKTAPVASETFVDFKDNATLTLKADGYTDAGEYLFYIENQSVTGEQVGVWSAEGAIANVRNYIDDKETASAARAYVKYIGEGFELSPISSIGSNEVDKTASDLYPDGEFVRRDMDKNDKYGVRFNADAQFEGCEVYIPAAPADTDGNVLTLALYKWMGNYAKTVKTESIVKQIKLNVERGSWVKLDCGKQAAGEYLFTVTDGSENIRVATVEAASGKSELYINCSACGISLVARLIGFGGEFKPLNAADENTYISADTWTAVDGLGRTVTTSTEAGEKRDRYVGIFYHTWHSSHYRSQSINVAETVAKYPEAISDYNHSAWKNITMCFWDEPLFGYYNNGVDRWVLRQHAELLADAGIDVAIFDNTNGTENYMSAINELLEVWSEARADGVKSPGISAMLNMFNTEDAATQIRELYNEIYSKGLYKDLWFIWEGKPLMVGDPSGLNLNDPDDKEIYEFFSWRPINPCYTQDYTQIIENGKVTSQWSPNQSSLKKYTYWKWISVYPQQSMLNVKTKEVEEMCVCIAENWSDAKGLTAMSSGLPGLYGRAYSVKNGGLDTSENAILYGANFAEQWEYALSVDPKFVYVTGWNEWVAGRYEEMWGTDNAIPDNALPGYSRDIEPSAGVLKDHYYYQLVSYVRKFKGAEQQVNTAVADKIDITAGEAQWENVQPEFKTYENNVSVRDYDGYKGYSYKNETGRNDIVSAKVTYDVNNVYFMVKTAENLTAPTDANWMRLFIGVEGADMPNWETFGYVINRQSPDGSTAVLEKSLGGWSWETVGSVNYTVSGNLLQIAVPRDMLGVAERDFTLNFKWADNNISDGDILSVYNDGDVAPCGRFRYTYTSTVKTEQPAVDETASLETEQTEQTDTLTGQNADTAASTEEKRGCCSAIGGLGVIAAVGCAVAIKKKKNED